MTNTSLIRSGIVSLMSRGAQIVATGAGAIVSDTAKVLLTHPLLWGSAGLIAGFYTVPMVVNIAKRCGAIYSRGYAAHNYRTNNSIDGLDSAGVLEGDCSKVDGIDDGVTERVSELAMVVYDPRIAFVNMLRQWCLSKAAEALPVVRVVVVGPCVKLAKRCGMEVRARMGNPTRTRANITLATQRCAAWIGEHATSLRKCYYQDCLAKAVLFTLTPSPSEVELARALNDPRVADRERYCSETHTIPLYRGVVGEWLSIIPWFRVPAMPNF